VLGNRLSPDLTPIVPPVRCWQEDRHIGCDLGQQAGRQSITVTVDLSPTAGKPPAPKLSVPSCTPDPDPARPGFACHLDRLPPGGEAQMHLAIKAGSQIGATPGHTVTLTANETDPNLGNNQGRFPFKVGTADPPPPAPEPVTETGDLALQARGPRTVVAGQPFTYTFAFTNQGATEIHNVRLESVVPPATELLGLAPEPPPCRQQGQTFTCSLPGLDGSPPLTFTLVLNGHGSQPMKVGLDPLLPGWPACTLLKERTFLHIVLCEFGALQGGQSAQVQVALSARGVHERATDYTAVVQAAEATANRLAITRTVSFTVQVRADLGVVSQVPRPAAPGGPLTYTLTVANYGPSDAAGVVLTDTWPAGARLISARPGPGATCRLEQAGAATAICALSRLDRWQTVTFTVTVALDGPLGHSVRVRSEQVDPQLTNNDLTESITPGGGND
jgi:uncharacterized repeat protein (TIGR01451 family)